MARAELVLRRGERRGEDGVLSMLCFLGLLERLRAIACNFDLIPIFQCFFRSTHLVIDV